MINLFGTLAIFIFPLLGHWLHLSDLQYGIFAGTSIQAVPQVVAGGFAFSAAAGRIAVVVKLVRVVLLAPVMVLLALTQRNNHSQQTRRWYHYVPPMVIGFLIVVAINAVGLLKSITINHHVIDIKYWLAELSTFLIIITMSAIGLMTNIKQLISAGPKAMNLALLSMLVLMVVSLSLIYFFI